MKLLALSAGKKNGNSEMLLKEALMGAEAAGVGHELIRLAELDIRSCRFCKICLRIEGGPEACVVKDDVPFVIEKFMQADGLIMSAPVYILTPPGILKLLADRMLEDLAGVMQTKINGGINRMGGKVYLDERSFKRRAGAFICQGGATTPHWIGLGIPMMHCNTFPRQVDLVDQMEVLGASTSVLNEKVMQRANKLGRHVAEAMLRLEGKSWPVDVLGHIKKQNIDVPEWRGDEPGTCPVCHSNLLTVKRENPVECAICGIRGEIKVVGNKITVTFSPQEQAESRLTIEGKRIHQEEIGGNIRGAMARTEEMAKVSAKYKDYGNIVKPAKKAVVKA
jgi:multimeric flavodoxin WrbA